jgi:Protein of unknown function (DUF2795)
MFEGWDSTGPWPSRVYAPPGRGRQGPTETLERAHTGESEHGLIGQPGRPQLEGTPTVLGRMYFPADKHEVASNAESNDAPQAVVDQIRNSAIERFDGLEEVLEAVRGR